VGKTAKVSLILGCAAALACGRISELASQVVQLRPHAGLSLPSRISLQQGELHVRQKVGVTAGARLTITFNQHFDVVTGVTYLPGYAIFRGAGKLIQVGTSSHVLSGSTGARYWLLPAARTFSWEVHTGLGVVFGGQPAYEDLFENSKVSGILGTTARYQIGRIVGLKLRVQHRLYQIRFGGGEAGASRQPLQVSFGMSLPFVPASP
jgi:hypothetical protein